MPKVVRLVASIPASSVSSRADRHAFDGSHFFPVALFSGIGLLASLIAILCGVQFGWY